MNAQLDQLLHVFRAVDVKDNPGRTAPSDAKDGAGRRWFHLSETEKRRTVQHWLCRQEDKAGFLSDLLSDLDPMQLLANFANGEDMLNGVLVNRLFMKLGQQIEDDEDYPL